MSDYPDPWGPGGKFIESGLEPVEEPDSEEDADSDTDDA